VFAEACLSQTRQSNHPKTWHTEKSSPHLPLTTESAQLRHFGSALAHWGITRDEEFKIDQTSMNLR
jgi:hypothetical protein